MGVSNSSCQNSKDFHHLDIVCILVTIIVSVRRNCGAESSSCIANRIYDRFFMDIVVVMFTFFYDTILSSLFYEIVGHTSNSDAGRNGNRICMHSNKKTKCCNCKLMSR